MLPHTRNVETPERLTMYVYAAPAPVDTFIMLNAPHMFVKTMAGIGTPRALVQPRMRGALPSCPMNSSVRLPMYILLLTADRQVTRMKALMR